MKKLWVHNLNSYDAKVRVFVLKALNALDFVFIDTSIHVVILSIISYY